jgi:hypothetical protein
LFQVPGGDVEALQRVVTCPPDASIFFSFPSAVNAILVLSGGDRKTDLSGGWVRIGLAFHFGRR